MRDDSTPFWGAFPADWRSFDRGGIIPDVQDYELIAQELSGLREKIGDLSEKVTGFAARMAEIERVNARLEDAALTTARALGEISGHWDAVYEAMRRGDESQEASEK